MSFEVGDCYAGITGLLMNRAVTQSVMNEALRKAVLELTNDYKHPLLEDTGPTVNLIAYQNSYSPNYFLNPSEDDLDIMKVNSFFFYNNPYAVPSEVNSQANSGYDLK